jgi:hypothetical protein
LRHAQDHIFQRNPQGRQNYGQRIHQCIVNYGSNTAFYLGMQVAEQKHYSLWPNTIVRLDNASQDPVGVGSMAEKQLNGAEICQSSKTKAQIHHVFDQKKEVIMSKVHGIEADEIPWNYAHVYGYNSLCMPMEFNTGYKMDIDNNSLPLIKTHYNLPTKS